MSGLNSTQKRDSSCVPNVALARQSGDLLCWTRRRTNKARSRLLPDTPYGLDTRCCALAPPL
jgi:hypothetical protein